MRTFLRWAAKILKKNWGLPLGNSSSCSRDTLGDLLSLRGRSQRFRPLLEVQCLEDRVVLSQGQAIFYSGSNGTPILVSPTDINAAFADILAASGRKDVVITQKRKGINDATANGSV